MCAISNPCVIWLMYIYSPAFTPITLPWGFTLHAHLWYCHGVSRYIHTCDIAMGFHAEHTEQNIKIAFSYMSISLRSCKYRLYVYTLRICICSYADVWGSKASHKMPQNKSNDESVSKICHTYLYIWDYHQNDIHTSIYMLYMHVNIFACTYKYRYMYMYIHIYVYLCIHIYMYIYMYTYLSI